MRNLLRNQTFQRAIFGFALLFWIKMNMIDAVQHPNDISDIFLLPNKIVFWCPAIIILFNIVFNRFVTWLFCVITYNTLIILISISKLFPSLDMYGPGKQDVSNGIIQIILIYLIMVGGVDYLLWKMRPIALEK